MDAYKFDLQIARGENNAEGSLFPLEIGRRAKSRLPFIMAGVDEAGRGPLAGPLVVAAVVLPSFPRVPGLNDSKQLSEPEREKIFPLIKRTALAMAISIVEPARIDELNILAATMAAMREAIGNLKMRPDLVLVDGNQKPKSASPELTIVKGDAKSACVMAASIVAKVTRDRLMRQFHLQYPEFGFDIHKGYGVPQHLEALKKLGPTPCHRKSFEPVKSMLKEPAGSLF